MTATSMMQRMRPLVLAAHLLALVGGVLYVWLQWSDISTQQTVIAQDIDNIAQLDARLEALRGRAPEASGRPASDPFLRGASLTVAGADLQTVVVSAIRSAGGTVTSSQIEASEAGVAPLPVRLTVACQIGDDALQGLLYKLESGTPAIFFDQIAVDAAATEVADAGPLGGHTLKITMTVSAYWAGEDNVNGAALANTGTFDR